MKYSEILTKLSLLYLHFLDSYVTNHKIMLDFFNLNTRNTLKLVKTAKKRVFGANLWAILRFSQAKQRNTKGTNMVFDFRMLYL